MKILQWTVIVVVLLAAVLIGAGQVGLLKGKPPTTLGVKNGRLAPPATSPNSVSSQADLYPGHPQQTYARIAPLPSTGGGPAAMARLASVIRQMPGVTFVTERGDYLYVQFHTRWLGFVDDAEFWLDPAARVIQVRSASRLGRSDFGVNRKRIEAIRRALAP